MKTSSPAMSTGGSSISSTSSTTVAGAVRTALIVVIATFAVATHATMDQLLTIRTCGKPNIQNIMSNVTAKPGQSAMFKCQVDMSCIVAYIEWYHEMDNGTEKLIKTASSSGDPNVHIIKRVNSADEGLYTCIAGNVLGQATASAYLEVNASPPFGPASAHLASVFATLVLLATQHIWRPGAWTIL
jgi:hypothetical protein